MRWPSPAQVIAPLAVVVALSGTAVAATGSGITLGRTNTSATTTSFDDSHGTPLRLVAKPGRPPLSVKGNATQVPSLNASLLGGLSARALSPQRLVLTRPGRTTVTVPKGFHHMLVLLVGGGGGGGVGDASEAGNGGGQGGTVDVWITAAPGSKWVVSVGGGGPAGQPGSGSDGVSTYIRQPHTAKLTAEATFGRGGVTPAECPDTVHDQSGAGGVSIVATSPVVVGVDGSAGTPGASCTSADRPGDAGNPQATGGGGNGGRTVTPSIAPVAGRAGVAVMEFLR